MLSDFEIGLKRECHCFDLGILTETSPFERWVDVEWLILLSSIEEEER